jgi:hypothetical protein
MSNPRPSQSNSPFTVGLCAWLLPGGGYLVLGQRTRGITVGLSIIALFLMGLLIGGIRIMDPPGWGQYGYMTQLVQRNVRTSSGEMIYSYRVEPLDQDEEQNPRKERSDLPLGWALRSDPMGEIGEKPWYVGQILCGPITLAASAVSVREARGTSDSPGLSVAHARSWELGALYTAVAGMLNLLVLIDAVYRAAVPVDSSAASRKPVAEAA